MAQFSKSITMVLLTVVGGNVFCFAVRLHPGKKRAKGLSDAAVTVSSGQAHCRVDVDGLPAGVTGSDGKLLIEDVDAGDHYLHINCPDQQELSTFISPKAGAKLQISPEPPAPVSAIDAAQARARLPGILLQADQLRASGQFDEAVKLLREATKLDRTNADLHRELGITFLINHQWEQARVEMLEAIHRDPSDVDAHSGLGYALEKLGDLHGSLEQYRTCTHLDPDEPSYQDHYVKVLAEISAQQAASKH